jgi:hypothetical protein
LIKGGKLQIMSHGSSLIFSKIYASIKGKKNGNTATIAITIPGLPVKN